MLIDFTVENYRSYRDAKTFSLMASQAKELANNMAYVPEIGRALLCVAAVYGPNASGKSNLLEAMNTLSELLVKPVERSYFDFVELPPFALDPSYRAKPCKFSVNFLHEGIWYE